MREQPPKLSSSKKATSSLASDPILDLGRKLVAALKADDDDLLSQWMAHHIAELIAECETADAAANNAANERCAAAILELWSHRASMTGASKPFSDLTPVIETLRALDPGSERFFYSRVIPNVGPTANEEITKWLNFAKNCDVIARMLIGMGIDKASEHANNSASGWAGAASRAGFATDLDIQITEALDKRLGERSQLNGQRIQDVKERIEKLESFLELASALRTFLQEELDGLERSGIQ